MQIKLNGGSEDLSAMLIGAERYALGRKTYIVQWTCEFIGNNLHLLTEKDKQVMIRDIENGKINMVVTKDLSRLGRDYIETGEYIEKWFPENNKICFSNRWNRYF